MLGIHGVGRDGADYYLSDLARELPVAGPGHWAGTAAAGLGLAGPVEPDEFRRLLEGRHPRTGIGARLGPGPVAAFDLTFSAPKSASVLFALGGAEWRAPVVAVHAEAVAGALSYLERHGVTAARRVGCATVPCSPTTGRRRRGVHPRGQPQPRPAPPQPRRGGEPGPRRGRALGRLRPRGIDAHRAAASAVYEAHLRAGLASALGVRWVGAPGPQRRDRRGGAGAAGRVLDRGRRHPPAHVRDGRPLGPRRPRRLGGHPARQGAGARRSPSSRSRLAAAGRWPSAAPLELELGPGPAGRAGRCSTSTASPG